MIKKINVTAAGYKKSALQTLHDAVSTLQSLRVELSSLPESAYKGGALKQMEELTLYVSRWRYMEQDVASDLRGREM